jgi:hypothetical protein
MEIMHNLTDELIHDFGMVEEEGNESTPAREATQKI